MHQAGRLAALGHEVRLRIVRELVGVYPAGRVAGRLQRAAGVPASTLSHHLDVLEREGLIARRREGRFQRYRASASGLQAVLDFLTTWCATVTEPADESARAGTSSPLYD